MKMLGGWAWVLAVLVACGGSELSRSAAGKGAEEFLEEAGPYRLLVGLRSSAPPWVVADHDPEAPRLRSLEELGLLASESRTLEEKGFTGIGVEVRQVPAREFRLTEEGEAAFLKQSAFGLEQNFFRYAKAEVTEVIEWTEPAPALGQVVSRVTFKARPAAVPEWARDDRFVRLFPAEAARLSAEPITLVAGLVKTSDGWRPASSVLSP